MKIWSYSKQKEVNPKDLPLKDLIRILKDIEIDTSNCWMPETSSTEGYAAIKEAIRRLKENKGVQENEPRLTEPTDEQSAFGKTINKPTEKQIKFAKSISEQLGIPLPQIQSRQSLFLFIRDNRGRFDEMREDVVDWDCDAGYGLQYGEACGLDHWGAGDD